MLILVTKYLELLSRLVVVMLIYLKVPSSRYNPKRVNGGTIQSITTYRERLLLILSMACYAQPESLSTYTPISDNTHHFIEATRSLLDEGDVTALDALASRLSPFRIKYRPVVVGDVVSVKPVLVLEHEQSPV